MTQVQILAFQQNPLNMDWLGKPLKVDGVLGPKTQWSMDIASLPHWRRDIVCLSLVEHAKDIIEIPPGSNRGKEIDKYIIWCNLDPKASKEIGFKWCAAASSYALSAGSHQPVRIAGVKRLAEALNSSEGNPQPGDLGYSLRPDGSGHCGILTGIDANDAMLNEGNSNNRMEVVIRSRKELKFASLYPDQITLRYPHTFAPYRTPGIGKGLPRAGSTSRTI